MKPPRVLAASLLLAGVLGSIHAFSIFIAPLETRFAAARADISLTYSFALVAVTLGVLAGGKVYRWLAPGRLAFAIGVTAAGGLAAAALSSALWQLWLGYSLVFGLANGLGYGFALHAAGQSYAGREGLAMGLVTAAYALGAAVAPFALAPWLSPQQVADGLLLLAASVLAASLLASLALGRAGFVLDVGPPPRRAARLPGERRGLALLWIGYGSAATAGLMAIGHASEIARAGGVVDAWVLTAPTLLALANMAGSLAGGALIDRSSVAVTLGALPLVTAASLLGLALLSQAALALGALALTGFAYGATIAAYPVATVRRYGAAAAVRLYGYVFTAWGVAGFIGPWCAGLLFDRSGSYRPALLLAAALALLSAALVTAGRRRLAPAAGQAVPEK